MVDKQLTLELKLIQLVVNLQMNYEKIAKLKYVSNTIEKELNFKTKQNFFKLHLEVQFEINMLIVKYTHH